MHAKRHSRSQPMCHDDRVVTTLAARSLCSRAERELGALLTLFIVCFSKDAEYFVLGPVVPLMCHLPFSGFISLCFAFAVTLLLQRFGL